MLDFLKSCSHHLLYIKGLVLHPLSLNVKEKEEMCEIPICCCLCLRNSEYTLHM